MLKENENFVSGMKKMGPELFPTPQGHSLIGGGLLKMTGAGNMGV